MWLALPRPDASPILRREDLNFLRTTISCFFHRSTDRREVDNAVTHHAAVEQKIACGDEPIADVVSKNAAAGSGARDLRVKLWIPPDVVHVDGNTDSVAQQVANIKRLFERVDAGAIGRVHGMQGLDSERHTAFPRMRKNRGKTIGHHLSRGRKISRSLGQSAYHQN